MFSTFRDLFDKIRPRINLSGKIKIPVSNLQSDRITKELPEALLIFFSNLGDGKLEQDVP